MRKLKAIKEWISHPLLSLIINLIFSVAHGIIGDLYSSTWFFTLAFYYAILTFSKSYAILVKKRIGNNIQKEKSVRKIIGILIIILSIILIGIIILCTVKERGTKHHIIVMISIALYSFIKVSISIISLIKVCKTDHHIEIALRNISLASALASIYSLQRSMLVTFGDMEWSQIQLFNVLTGSMVCILTLLLGINLIGGKKIEMAKSKIVKVNQKIAKGVVDGYKTVESGVVKAYTKIEDKFVDKYLSRENETVEEAKERLKNQNKK